MGVINHVASAVNLAKAWKMSLDHTKVDATIPTATLLLMLNAIIELGEGQPGTAGKTAEVQAKAVSERMSAFQSAIKERDS